MLLSKNNEIIIEESLYGYKEFELEILIDLKKNFITVCSIENIDPVGIHTGDSLCVSPIQTLTNNQFQKIRNISKKVIKKLKITAGGANIQFAICPFKNDIKIIEVNPRLSRSSALASKATGYPIAKISSKIALGYKINNVLNEIVNKTAFFEPSLDYIVIKNPLFAIQKFGYLKIKTDNQMKSVGESMSISNNFESALLKSFNNINNYFQNECYEKKNLFKKNFTPNPERIHNLYEFLKLGKKLNTLNFLTKIDSLFLNKIKNIIVIENKIKKQRHLKINKKTINLSKFYGFSDLCLACFNKTNYLKFINYRILKNLLPSFKRVDNCANEFKTKVNYFYSTYLNKCEYIQNNNKKKIIVVGSGPNNIGQGIEFDYCCVHASLYLKKNNYYSIILNNNPETVSTDYDISNTLFFLKPDFENLINIYIKNKPYGIIIQFCGQLSNFIIKNIQKYQLKVLGTKIKSINLAEDRKKFKKKIKKTKLFQPDSLVIKNKQNYFKKKKKLNILLLQDHLIYWVVKV